MHHRPAAALAERLRITRHLEAALTNDAVKRAVEASWIWGLDRSATIGKLADRPRSATVGAMADGAVGLEQRPTFLHNFRRGGERIGELVLGIDTIEVSRSAHGDRVRGRVSTFASEASPHGHEPCPGSTGAREQ